MDLTSSILAIESKKHWRIIDLNFLGSTEVKQKTCRYIWIHMLYHFVMPYVTYVDARIFTSISVDTFLNQHVMKIYPLVNFNITIEKHNFEQVNQRTKWGIFNSYVTNYQRLNIFNAGSMATSLLTCR